MSLRDGSSSDETSYLMVSYLHVCFFSALALLHHFSCAKGIQLINTLLISEDNLCVITVISVS